MLYHAITRLTALGHPAIVVHWFEAKCRHPCKVPGIHYKRITSSYYAATMPAFFASEVDEDEDDLMLRGCGRFEGPSKDISSLWTSLSGLPIFNIRGIYSCCKSDQHPRPAQCPNETDALRFSGSWQLKQAISNRVLASPSKCNDLVDPLMLDSHQDSAEASSRRRKQDSVSVSYRAIQSLYVQQATTSHPFSRTVRSVLLA